MSGELPRVAGHVLADAVDALSPRLRKRLDDSAVKAASWEVTSEDGRVVVAVDDDTHIVLTLDDGAVRSAEAVTCSCLLAPACLHRAALLGIAPSLDDDTPTAATSVAEDLVAAAEDVPQLTADQLAAIAALQAVAEELVNLGLVGSGLATEATLRRAVYAARGAGLHRAAATGSRVAAQLRSYRTRSRDHQLGVYTDELRTLMENARSLSSITDARLHRELIGVGRRSHEQRGGMRLTGLFSEPIIGSAGMAGVVTCSVDADGALWSVPAVAPGGPERVEAAYKGPVGLGGAAASHRDLVRGGLIVSGAAASIDGSLSHGAGVRSVRASGATWWEPPLDTLFAEPLTAATPSTDAKTSTSPATGQFARALGTNRAPRAGADLLFCEIVILPVDISRHVSGARPGDVSVSLDGTVALLRSPAEHQALAYADNLSILSGAPGLRLRVIARPDRIRPGILYPLAAAPDPTQTGLTLPESWQGRVCLGLDRLHDSMRTLTQEPHPDDFPTRPRSTAAAHVPIHLLRGAIERTAAGGRRAARFASARQDSALLRSAGMPNAATALDRLSLAASAPERDDYGRQIPAATTAFAESWLAAALFEAAASTGLAVQSWSSGREGASDDRLEVESAG